MVLGEVFEAFVKESPISVMVCGTLERIFHPAVLNQVFQDHAILNYTKELTFAHCVEIMSAVVFRQSPSVGAYYQAHADKMPVSRQALYNELQRIEPQVAAALVHDSAQALLPSLQSLGS